MYCYHLDILQEIIKIVYHRFYFNSCIYIKFKNLYRLKKGNKIYINEVEGIDNEYGVSTTYPEIFCGEKIDYNVFSGIFVWASLHSII